MGGLQEDYEYNAMMQRDRMAEARARAAQKPIAGWPPREGEKSPFNEEGEPFEAIDIQQIVGDLLAQPDEVKGNVPALHGHFSTEEYDVLEFRVRVPKGYKHETLQMTAKFGQILAEAAELFAHKQEAYGKGNIAKFGELGVLVRASDKLERLANILREGGDNSHTEAVIDSWWDLLNYGGIGVMTHRKEWY